MNEIEILLANSGATGGVRGIGGGGGGGGRAGVGARKATKVTRSAAKNIAGGVANALSHLDRMSAPVKMTPKKAKPAANASPAEHTDYKKNVAQRRLESGLNKVSKKGDAATVGDIKKLQAQARKVTDAAKAHRNTQQAERRAAKAAPRNTQQAERRTSRRAGGGRSLG